MIERDYLGIHTIVCPCCKHKQTGIVKESPGLVVTIASSDLLHKIEQVKVPCGEPYIRCCFIHCQHIITSDELAEVTAQRVQFPNQINK